MASLDLNLLIARDVLLAERSIPAAAKRMSLSVSAMSRTLTRLRLATGDPLIVQAGRCLVPTPYAKRLADRVHTAAEETRAVLGPTSYEIHSPPVPPLHRSGTEKRARTTAATEYVVRQTGDLRHLRTTAPDALPTLQ